jgi:hypothetical protein
MRLEKTPESIREPWEYHAELSWSTRATNYLVDVFDKCLKHEATTHVEDRASRSQYKRSG